MNKNSPPPFIRLNIYKQILILLLAAAGFVGCSEDNKSDDNKPECTKDEDCAARTDNKTKCDLTSQKCTEPTAKPECTKDEDCAARTDNKTKCDTTSQKCTEPSVKPECTKDDDCAARTDGKTKCDLTSQKCTEPQTTQAVCGDGKIEGTEKCDGENLNGKTCATVSNAFHAGRLACNECEFDTRGCFECEKNADCSGKPDTSCIDHVCTPNPKCGDKRQDENELCDGSDFKDNKILCREWNSNYSSGKVSCNPDCTINYKDCVEGFKEGDTCDSFFTSQCGNNNSLFTCNDGIVKKDNCAEHGLTCIGGACVLTPKDDCDSSFKSGCVGNDYVYCSSDHIKINKCDQYNMQCTTVGGNTGCYLPCDNEQTKSVCLIDSSTSYEVPGTCKKSDDGKHLVLKPSGEKVECDYSKNQLCLSGKCTDISNKIPDLKCDSSDCTDICLDKSTVLRCNINTVWSVNQCNAEETCIVDWRNNGQCAKKCDASLYNMEITYCAQKHNTSTMSVRSYTDQCDEIDGQYYWMQFFHGDNYCSSYDCDATSGECKPEISAYDDPVEKCTNLNATRKICNLAYNNYSGSSDDNGYWFENNIFESQSITQTCKKYNNSDNYWMFEESDVISCPNGCDDSTGDCIN